MLHLYNSLTKEIDEFKPLKPSHVSMYVCGPTVYQFAHIGNFRTYTMTDVLLRTLRYDGYSVEYVMNLTDVGHLTGDNLGDADTGEDKMEKSAKKEGKSAWEIASFYTDAFLEDFKKLNLEEPTHLVKATDHIQEQIELIGTLEEKGYTYQTRDGIYFDTTKFPSYGQLSDLDQIKEGARVEKNEEKRNPRDFALWKFSPNHAGGEKRQMEWKSPWGVGFPGWHVECSAMSMKYLGPTIDIHAGGMDLKQIHHPNEIAQSEAATGQQFVHYWMHVAFMLVQGEKMSKSLGNTYRVYDLERNGHSPLALRYLYLQTHYRQEMNFTFPALEAAQNALDHLYELAATFGEAKGACLSHEQRFIEALNDDLNTSEAIAAMWDMLKSTEPKSAKLQSLLKMDSVLGLGIKDVIHDKLFSNPIDLPPEIWAIVKERNELRRSKHFVQADHLRNKLRKLGYELVDSDGRTDVRLINK
jgi:cysteinyl-tRNA synthetase